MTTTFADERVRRIAALAGLNIVLALGGWLALVSPQQHHAAAASQQLQTVQAQLQSIAAMTTPVAPKQPRIHTADVYVLDHAMPLTEDEADLLLTLDQVARAAGVDVTTISPQEAVQAVGYTTMPISLTVVGSYSAITSFLAHLRGLVTVQHGKLYASGRLFSIQSLSLAPEGATPGPGGTNSAATGSTAGSVGSGSGARGANRLQATMTVDAYVFGVVAGAQPLPVTAASTTGTSTTSTTSTTTTSG